MRKYLNFTAGFFLQAVIAGVVNYLFYAFKLPVVYSVLPTLPITYLVSLKFKEKSRIFKYIYTLPHITIYFFFTLYMYYKIKPLTLPALLLSVLLVIWCILCVEGKIKFNKISLIYLSAYFLLCLFFFAFIRNYYNRKAGKAIDYILYEKSPELTAASETDGLCMEIDIVFYSSGVYYNFTDLVNGYIYHTDDYKDKYAEFKNALKNSEKNMNVLLNAVYEISENQGN